MNILEKKTVNKSVKHCHCNKLVNECYIKKSLILKKQQQNTIKVTERMELKKGFVVQHGILFVPSSYS